MRMEASNEIAGLAIAYEVGIEHLASECQEISGSMLATPAALAWCLATGLALLELRRTTSSLPLSGFALLHDLAGDVVSLIYFCALHEA